MESILPGLTGAPNAHPIFVHFPLALWPVALLLLGLGILRDKREVFKAGCWLLYLGMAGALLAAGSGFWATQMTGHDAPGHELVHVHRNWMIAATLLGVSAAFSAVLAQKLNTPQSRWLPAGLLLLTVVVSTLGADRGANLVFRYGIGTAGEPIPGSVEEHEHDDGDHHDHQDQEWK